MIWNYYCVGIVWLELAKIKGAKNNFAREAANFYGSQIKWFLYYLFTPA